MVTHNVNVTIVSSCVVACGCPGFMGWAIIDGLSVRQ